MSLTVFAQRLKQAREGKGLKQNELAKAVGVTPTTISAYEKSDDAGNGKKPTLENAQSIAKALDVSLDWLCGMADNAVSPYTEFSARKYFESLITVMMETSSVFDETSQNGISITNPAILAFLKKINDLIKVYRAGSIPEDLFNVCVEKILNDYERNEVIGNCVLDKNEASQIEQRVFDTVNESRGVGAGMLNTSVINFDYGYPPEREVHIFISTKMLKKYALPDEFFSVSEEVPDNGKHKTEEE